MLSLLARYSSIYEPRLVKSEEQVAKERKAAIDAQAMMDANKQAAQTVGGIVETAATTAMQGTR
jgi:Xaa-Pro aminopeptidase